jgi:hypothetical protein
MQNPQVKFKGGIVRVNLDSGMSQSGLGLSTWFQAHGIDGPWFCMSENACEEAFIRLVRLHCKVAWR